MNLIIDRGAVRIGISSRRSKSPERIVLYSPGIVGLGHMRRNLLIGQTLTTGSKNASVLMIAEERHMGSYSMPIGMDCVILPALHKDANGQFGARYLNMPLEDLVDMRSNIIGATLKAFDPDVLIVDNLPRGAQRELDSPLKSLREKGHTRCVLGLRDILDDPDVVQREWQTAGNFDVIRRNYDSIWIYGDKKVYDQVSQYSYPSDIAAKVRYTGYLDQRTRLDFADKDCSDPLEALALPHGTLTLCLVGGGQDGGALAECLADAELPPDMNLIIVTGPFMPAAARLRLRLKESANPRLRVLEFLPEPTQLLKLADRVIAMGGYNTVSEILCFEKPALIVPRVKPRLEQLIRAERLQHLGLLEYLHPDNLDPKALANWLSKKTSPSQVRSLLELNGLECIPNLIRDLTRKPIECHTSSGMRISQYAI